VIVVGSPVVEWVAKRTNEFGNFGCATGIGIEKDGVLVAGVAYNEYNGRNVNTHIAISDGRMTRQFLWTIFDYPFVQLNVGRITALIGEGNMKSRNLCERLGFKEEARLKDSHPTGDTLIFRMFKDECRWLGLRHE
jgi:RimJ/RimL family protein N-acetyltransferase